MNSKRISFSSLWRKKSYNEINVHETKLSRVLGVFDVTCIGTSLTIAGVYMLLGDVVSMDAGPGAMLSFVIAGFATLLAGLCYAELGSRVPRAGSAYTYIYVTIGEMTAFVMGWDIILEYVIGSAGVSSALSHYIDFFFDNKIHDAFAQVSAINIKGLTAAPDFLAFGVCMIATLLMLLGVRESALLTKILTILNLGFLLFAFVLGATKIDFNNWKLRPVINGTNQTCTDPVRTGSGGFLPFGFSGVWTAGAKCFYAYIGFDAICACGEEVREPKRTIPLGIIFTLIIVSVVYFAMSAILTLMVPYCLIDSATPLPYAFVYVGYDWAKYIVATGGSISIAACLFTSMYPMPRVVYTMANDGLLFKPFYYLIPKFKTPCVATLATGFLASVLALIVDLNELINMMSIGTLLAYSIVCICVLVLRYRPFDHEKNEGSFFEYFVRNKEISVREKIFTPMSTECNRKTAQLANLAITLAVILIIALCLILNLSRTFISVGCLVPSSIISALILIISFIIWRQPQNQRIGTFKAPFLPFLPLFAVFINAYLAVNLPIDTLYRFVAWFALGLLLYFSYGFWHSKESSKLAHTEKNSNLCKKWNSTYVENVTLPSIKALLCLFLDLNELIDMMSIGTLLAYSIVCICVLVLRYRPMDSKPSEQTYFEYLTKEKSVNVFKKIFWKVSSKCDRNS